LNLMRAECFCEFVSEIRDDQRSHLLLMPPLNEPVSVRVTRMLLRHYPQFPHGSQRWDDRVFHPDESGGIERPISKLWKKPPAFVERNLSCIRLAECGLEQRSASRVFRDAEVADIVVEEVPAPVAAEAVSTEALL